MPAGEIVALYLSLAGHESEMKVEPTGTKKLNEIHCPIIIEKYNKLMGELINWTSLLCITMYTVKKEEYSQLSPQSCSNVIIVI